jgi:hypothetical protein
MFGRWQQKAANEVTVGSAHIVVGFNAIGEEDAVCITVDDNDEEPWHTARAKAESLGLDVQLVFSGGTISRLASAIETATRGLAS